ncbi:MAG: hypothetical protein O3B73_11660 [bacterium]|nr:hypothetical protein [bacterium]
MHVRQLATVGLIMFSAFSGGAVMTWVVPIRAAYAQSRNFSPAGWEYQRVTHAVYSDNDSQFQTELKRHASEGWELIQVNEGAQYSRQIVTYWKRIKSSTSY